MASYTVRIELHSATYDDYETLHAAMERVGFSRTITSDQGAKYHLPTAEYDISTTADSARVLAIAAEAAKTTRRSFGVLVSQAVQRMWQGLAST